MYKEIIPICGFTPPPNGILKIDGVVTKFNHSFQTLERYKEYRDCGFTELLIAGEDKYCGEDFGNSKLKTLMDLALQADLKVIVYDERFVELTVKAQENIIGEVFDREESLNDYVADCMKDYVKHPAFYGVSILDEPVYTKENVVRQVTNAVHSFCPNAFVMTCFLPCIQDLGLNANAFGKGYNSVWDSYSDYAQKMGNAIGYYNYDCYPFGMWEGKNDMCSGFIRNMQVAVDASIKSKVPFHMTIQSFSSGLNDELRRVDESDLNWQSNLALGFGCKKIYYFTYWRFSTRDSKNFTSAIMDDDGRKIIYDEVQRNNTLIQKVAKYLQGYEYVGSQVFKAEHGNKSTDNIIEKDLGFIGEFSSTAPVLLNELTNGKSKIYMLLNLRDPFEKFNNGISFSLEDDCKTLSVVKQGETVSLKTDNGSFEISLEPGEAIFILR